MSNPALHGRREECGSGTERYHNCACDTFSNAYKKSLAFMSREGVASASVQGLKIACSSLDGEAMRGFRKLVWSESAKCGSWRCGSVGGLHCLYTPVPKSLHPI